LSNAMTLHYRARERTVRYHRQYMNDANSPMSDGRTSRKRPKRKVRRSV
ncbi:MAG: hypothetical protein K0Q89_3180, partial [Thermomicrobiales bacterium]|nr:hypothetical protein [Thermomicrobiales bacterium]